MDVLFDHTRAFPEEIKRSFSNEPLFSNSVFELPCQRPEDDGKLTVVLDIDETLIHTELVGLFDCVVESEWRDTFFLELHGLKLRVRKRPFLMEFLKDAADRYELIAFTAGAEDYATAILDHIDPSGTIFRHRLFRQHCVHKHGQNFIKDLRILNRRLSRTVLVDNNAHSFIMQLGNGIPIASFFNDSSDKALAYLHHFLESIMHDEDVRHALKHVFRLEDNFDDYIRRQVIVHQQSTTQQ